MTRRGPTSTRRGAREAEAASEVAAQTPSEWARAASEASGGVRRQEYVLRLYVAGLTARSTEIVERVREICQEKLKGRYKLEVIDIYQLPALARGDQIIATPTLVRLLPTPLRRYIGNLSKENLVFGLDLREGST